MPMSNVIWALVMEKSYKGIWEVYCEIVANNGIACARSRESSVGDRRSNLKSRSDGKLHQGVWYFVFQKNTEPLVKHFLKRDYTLAYANSNMLWLRFITQFKLNKSESLDQGSNEKCLLSTECSVHPMVQTKGYFGEIHFSGAISLDKRRVAGE